MKPPTTPPRRTLNDGLRRRLTLLAGETQHRRSNAAVQRVLALLADDAIAAEAAKTPAGEGFELECGVLDRVWDDPRIANRRNQLDRQGILVERVPVETTVAGKTFRRSRLRVSF